MAGDWIKMRADLRTHPKVVRIASALHADRLKTVGGLHAVWCLFDEHSTDGSLEGYSPEVIDDLIGWPGFSAAMIAVEWLEVSDGFAALPQFDEHNGKSAKRRAQEAQRKRLERAAEESGQPSASDADKKRSREEKRREEESKEERASPNGEGGKPPPELTRDELWSAGKSLLTEAGMPPKQCGSFVGKLVKDYGDAIVIEAVRAAVVNRPVDPASYLKGACLHAAGKRSHRPARMSDEERDAWNAAEGVKARELLFGSDDRTGHDVIDIETHGVQYAEN